MEYNVQLNGETTVSDAPTISILFWQWLWMKSRDNDD